MHLVDQCETSESGSPESLDASNYRRKGGRARGKIHNAILAEIYRSRHHTKMRCNVAITFFAYLLMPVWMGAAQVVDEDECVRLHPEIVSPVEMANCTFDVEGSEDTLAQTLTNLRQVIPHEYGTMLDESQAAWAAYRDSECKFEAGGYPGSTGWSSSILACKANMNRDRVETLNEYKKMRQ